MHRPANAADGDAHGIGARFDLAADVGGDTVIEAATVIGSATAPPTLGSDSDTALDIALPGAVGVSADGTVDEVIVTRRPYYTTADSTVSDVAVSILGVPTLAVTTATAWTICGSYSYPDTATTVDGLTVFGTAVSLTANGSPVTSSRAVSVTGLTDARLSVSVTRTETRVFGTRSAAAAAVTAAFEITGAAAGAPVTIPVGTVAIAEATCERPPEPARPAGPVMTSIEPAVGPQSGGNRFTITGDNFFAGYTYVRFNGRLVTDLTFSPDLTTLYGTVPIGDPGPARIWIHANGPDFEQEAAYTYLIDGSKSYFSRPTPPSGAAGTTVRITGFGLASVLGVTFDGVPGTNLDVAESGDLVTVHAPPRPLGPTQVELVFPGGTRTAGDYEYAEPTVTGINPAVGPSTGFIMVRIAGLGLSATTEIRFGGVPGLSLHGEWGFDGWVVTVPPGPVGPVDVELIMPGPDLIVPDGFTYLAAQPTPAITGVDPGGGPAGGGTTVVVTGTGLADTTEVTFGGASGTDLVVDPSGTSLTVVTPPGDAGPVDVVAVTPGDDVTLVDGFTYRAGATPRIDSVNPGEGSTAGGTTMTVSGANFIPEQTRVTICGQLVGPSLVTVSGAFNVLTFPTPECDAGTTTISVTTAAGTSNEVTFRYVGDGPPGAEPPSPEPSDTEPPGTGLPVTGRASGQIAVGGVLAVLLGAALRLMAGRRSQRR
ncbi:IPT/TIG domain-containing protein [Micromonospora sp. NBC_01813]|uniref:IPT/TIG domain-containing protein n=1 Tax=Micromonospora sp. NBC_01813 TaxID=2975988 RepID=UPI002DDBAB8C|nr:IPT/TIG domain-containing protein [Micromonospora sp. NBC_01813]WSA07334.1 IPT/TIG domain-containing protein [Micromonospora sp. NBC_01813]